MNFSNKDYKEVAKRVIKIKDFNLNRILSKEEAFYLLIKDIKSDLYQVKIFPNIQEDYNNGIKGLGIYSSINTYFPYNDPNGRKSPRACGS